MGTTDEIGRWVGQRIVEVERRHSDPTDPNSEDVRQLVAALKGALVGAQQLQRVAPNFADMVVRHMAKPFAGYEGYQDNWDPSQR